MNLLERIEELMKIIKDYKNPDLNQYKEENYKQSINYNNNKERERKRRTENGYGKTTT